MTGDAKEWEWEAFAARAIEAYEDGRRPEAVHLWTCAGKISGSFAPGDPRHAASANNLAIVSLIAERHEAAAAGFESAVEMWDQAMSWTQQMQVEPVGRSSLFHLRMAERHEDAFKTVRQSRWQESLVGAKALTWFNLAIARLFLDDDAEADRLLAQAAQERETSRGLNNPELANIIRVISGRLCSTGQQSEAEELDRKIEAIVAAASRSSFACWKDEQPAELNDTRRLLAAAQLTAMVHERDFL